jgi:hypothetical protein
VIYRCCEERRRAAVARHPTLNGIDFLEVVDSDAATPEDRQRILRLRLVKPLGPVTVTPDNVAISGGDRVRDIHAVTVTTNPASPDVEIRLNQRGDYSRYTLRLVELVGGEPALLTGFDGPMSAVEFGFKAECPDESDCAQEGACPPAERPGHDIDYLAKDYQSFRRLMLDRITTLSPEWTERHAADFGVSLVELLAYVGDHLSYQQDAVGTEAYLATARRRVSVRRHARLIDYRIDEGAAARVLVHVRVAAGLGPIVLPATPSLVDAAPIPGRVAALPVRFLTANPARTQPAPVVGPDSAEFAAAVAAGAEVFELAEVADRTLYRQHNEMRLHTWGGRECCLPSGAIRATLVGDLTTLQVGDVVVLAETKGPRFGLPADADPAHRHAVRLTEVTLGEDPLAGFFEDDLPSGGAAAQPFPVTEIAWDVADALPFPLCVSAEIGGRVVDDLSVALGNIVLADHGLTLPEAEELPEVPASTLSRVLAGGHPHCVEATEEERRRRFVPARYRPRLGRGPLTWQARVVLPARAGGTAGDDFGPSDRSRPVAELIAGESVALPALRLTEAAAGETWTARPDLLSSDAAARDMVVEVEDDAGAAIRFGDDVHGRRPNAGDRLFAHYRIGQGVAGNIGVDAIRQVATTVGGIESATNPLAGWGGREPQSLEEVRQQAPIAFRSQERAVTADDYAAVAQRHPGVQRAVATIEWTGSWRTVFVTVDRIGGLPVDPEFTERLRAFLERFRLAGHDVEVQAPVFVPLEIELFVCVAPERFRSDVRAALLDVFSSGIRANGRPGLFHPDQFSFGQPVQLSRLVAAAQAVAGVASVEVTMFRRFGQPASSALDTGELRLDRTEIARLDNDPNFPDRGVLRINLGGGR